MSDFKKKGFLKLSDSRKKIKLKLNLSFKTKIIRSFLGGRFVVLFLEKISQ